MNEVERRRQIQELVEDYGLDEEDAAFAVRLAAGETRGDAEPITLPVPEAKAKRYIEHLVDHHSFTLDEAMRYVAGDRTVIDSVAARRREVMSDNLANIGSQGRTIRLSAD